MTGRQGRAAKIKVRRNRKGVAGALMLLLLLLRYGTVRYFLHFIRFLRHFCCFFLSVRRDFTTNQRGREIQSKVERDGARDK